MTLTRALFVLSLLPSLAVADTRDDVARHYAPIIYQETNDARKDHFAAFDYDGDWVGTNNLENLGAFPLVGTVYYSVIETTTHWFVQYMPYHPVDWKVTNGHEHDTESMLAVVAKAGGGLGQLQALEMRFHIEWLDYADAGVTNGAGVVRGPIHFDATSGRPAVYSQMVGHGICGGFSPPNFLFPDLALVCDHAAAPHIAQTGLVYSPDLPAVMPTIVSGAATPAGYALVDLRATVWPHIHEIGAGHAFKSAIDYQGARCNQYACPTQFGGDWNGDNGTSPGEPWVQEGGPGSPATGEQFFDPAYAFSKRLGFPQPFALVYCYNPYLGVDDSCPAVTAPGEEPPGEVTTDGGIPGTGPDLAEAGKPDAPLLPPDAGGGCQSTPGVPSSASLFAFAFAFALVRRRAR